jgi:hypothetical protein
MFSPRQMDTNDEEENSTNKSPTLVIKTPEHCKHCTPSLPEEASNDYEKNRVTMYPTDVHTTSRRWNHDVPQLTWTYMMLLILQRRRLGYSCTMLKSS